MRLDHENKSLNDLGDNNDPPPEPGSARREAHKLKERSNEATKRRLLKRKAQAAARKEGA
jgi:hypothetical protein